MAGMAATRAEPLPDPARRRGVKALAGPGSSAYQSDMSTSRAATDDPDARLLALYSAGDPAAAAALAQSLGPRALGVAFRMLNDRGEAEDVMQEAMLRLWRAAPAWRSGEARVSTWLLKVVGNLCIDRLRQRRRRAGPALDAVPEPADDAPSAETMLQAQSRAEALSDALQALPDRQRQAVVLRHIEGLANPEIAAVMDISVDAVESLTARGKRMLAAALAGRRAELGYTDD